MKALLVTPNNKSELKLLMELFRRMNLGFLAFDDIIEAVDKGLLLMMKSADRKKMVSKKIVLTKLKKQG